MTQPRRFGIGEWYGHSFVGLTRNERRAYATGTGSQPCPFRMGGGLHEDRRSLFVQAI